MFGQSFLFTTLTLNLTRRVTYCTKRCFGATAAEASRAADEIAIPAAAAVAAMTSVLTVDPAGAALSASYIAAESGEAENRHGSPGGGR